MATADLDDRVRELASEMEGEKLVTRQVYQQSLRNADVLGALQLSVTELTNRADHLVHEVIQNTAAVRTHGARLDALTRDVALLRNEAIVLRRGQEELHVRIDRLQEALEGRLDHVDGRLDHVDGRLDRLEGRLDRMQEEQAARHAELMTAIGAMAGRASPGGGAIA